MSKHQLKHNTSTCIVNNKADTPVCFIWLGHDIVQTNYGSAFKMLFWALKYAVPALIRPQCMPRRQKTL